MIELPGQPSAGRKLGGYEVLLRLKSGGMGDVLLARKCGAGGFEKLVALKTIRAEFRDAEQPRKMFLDEAKLLARLSHPAIAQVYDFGEDGDELFLAMEYVEGIRFRTLSELRPPPEIAARAMIDVCRGLHTAHELTDLAGNPMVVVHRDVTPENLMLTFDGRVKILDFGIALMRGRQAPATELGTIKGKPPYLSPEQIKNEPVDRRTDIFSASIVLHELLTGEPLFVGDSVYAVARAIEHEDVAPPSASAGPLPDGLDAVVLRGLGRDPAERYPTALALAEALERVITRMGGESLEAFAKRELGGEHTTHRQRLQLLLSRVGSAMSGAALRSRPSGVLTAQAATAFADTSPDEEVPDLSTAEIDAAMAPRSGRSSPTLGVAALLLAVVGLGLGVFLLWPEGSGSRADEGALAAAGASAGDAGAGTRDASIVGAQDGPPVAGATQVRAPDAGVAASTPKRGGGRRAGESPPPGPAAPEPPAAREISVPPTVQMGVAYLTVAADPFALVRIDGAEVGTTPIFRREVTAGTHEVVLSSPDSGTVRLHKSIDLAAGAHEKVILR